MARTPRRGSLAKHSRRASLLDSLDDSLMDYSLDDTPGTDDSDQDGVDTQVEQVAGLGETGLEPPCHSSDSWREGHLTTQALEAATATPPSDIMIERITGTESIISDCRPPHHDRNNAEDLLAQPDIRTIT